MIRRILMSMGIVGLLYLFMEVTIFLVWGILGQHPTVFVRPSWNPPGLLWAYMDAKELAEVQTIHLLFLATGIVSVFSFNFWRKS